MQLENKKLKDRTVAFTDTQNKFNNKLIMTKRYIVPFIVVEWICKYKLFLFTEIFWDKTIYANRLINKNMKDLKLLLAPC